MRFTFWGVRGSIPKPLAPDVIRSKITSVVQRIRPVDLHTPEARERFLAQLPPWIFGTTGSNTSCIEISLDDQTCIILDAGSGMLDLANEIQKYNFNQKTYHIFFSHFHWDHIQGLPFFSPAYNPTVSIHFYSPVKNFEEYLKEQMRHPYFPVTMDAMNAKLYFHELTTSSIDIGAGKISYRKMNHPGGCYSYKIEENGKSMIYSTDSELTPEDFEKNNDNISMFKDVNALIMDSQYTLDEAVEKYNWGHSSFSLAVDFASEWGIKKLFLFHHEPQYDDKKLYNNLQSARWYCKHLEKSSLEIELAVEGKNILI